MLRLAPGRSALAPREDFNSGETRAFSSQPQNTSQSRAAASAGLNLRSQRFVPGILNARCTVRRRRRPTRSWCRNSGSMDRATPRAVDFHLRQRRREKRCDRGPDAWTRSKRGVRHFRGANLG